MYGVLILQYVRIYDSDILIFRKLICCDLGKRCINLDSYDGGGFFT